MVYIAKDFGNTITAVVSENFTKEQVNDYLQNYISSWRGILVALNNHQVDKIGEVFLENGFAEIANFYYDGHGNNIHLFLRKPKQQINRQSIKKEEDKFSLEEISKDFMGEGNQSGYFDQYLNFRLGLDTYGEKEAYAKSLKDRENITFKEWFKQFKTK